MKLDAETIGITGILITGCSYLLELLGLVFMNNAVIYCGLGLLIIGILLITAGLLTRNILK